jgi:cold-inducible RNA-binding protein
MSGGCEISEIALSPAFANSYDMRGWFANRVVRGPLQVPRCLDRLPTFSAGISVAFIRGPESKTADRSQLSGSRAFMGKKLYVGNLAYTVTSSDLQQLFTAHGTVLSARVIEDRDAGRSKGFGFVEMGSDDEARAAIAALNGQMHGERALTVNEAKPRESRGGQGGGRGYGRG